MYASSAWWGFTDAAERTRLNRLLASLRNLHAWRMMVCSGQFPPTRTMFSGIILKTKTLLEIICAPVVITLLFLVKTLAILYPGFFMQFYFSAIICLFLFNCLTILVVM